MVYDAFSELILLSVECRVYYDDDDEVVVVVVYITANCERRNFIKRKCKIGSNGFWHVTILPQIFLWQFQCLGIHMERCRARNTGFECLHKVFCGKFHFFLSFIHALSFTISSKQFHKHNSIWEIYHKNAAAHRCLIISWNF